MTNSQVCKLFLFCEYLFLNFNLHICTFARRYGTATKLTQIQRYVEICLSRVVITKKFCSKKHEFVHIYAS